MIFFQKGLNSLMVSCILMFEDIWKVIVELENLLNVRKVNRAWPTATVQLGPPDHFLPAQARSAPKSPEADHDAMLRPCRRRVRPGRTTHR
jgi:hypothetical protein